MGTVPQATKVLSFTIPQPRSVERWPGPAEGLQASEAPGESGSRDMAGGRAPLSVSLLWGHLVHPGVALASGPGREGGEASLWGFDLKRSNGRVANVGFEPEQIG